MFEDVPKKKDIEYKFIKKDYYELLKEINNKKVYNEKFKIAQIANKMAYDLCKMDYYTVGLCGLFAGVKGLLTNPDFIYACVSKDCKQARKDFKQKLYQEMFNNGDIMMLKIRDMINPKQKELLQDISMLNSFFALCVNTVQMMYKYHTNGSFQLDDNKLEKSYNQLCGNEQSMMDAIHKNIRAIVYLAKGGSLPLSSHPNNISRLASYFLNNVLPPGQRFLSISEKQEGHKTDAANRELNLGAVGADAYVSIEMFNCLANDTYKMIDLSEYLGNKGISFIQNWLQERKQIVKNNLNLPNDIANYTSQQLLHAVQQKAMQTAKRQSEQPIFQQALKQIALCLQCSFNTFPWNAQSPSGRTYGETLGFPQQLQSFYQNPTLQNYIYVLFAAQGTPIYGGDQDINAIEIMQTFADIKDLNSRFVDIINTTYGQNINKNFSNHLIANFLSLPFEQQYRNTLCQQLDAERKNCDKSINNILNWSEDQQPKIQMQTQYLPQNYPGLKAIATRSHYYNTYNDIRECGNAYVPSPQYNNLKVWGPAQGDKQLSFDLIKATPKDIDRQTNNQQPPNLTDFVCHDQKDKAGSKTDCLLNLMGFNDDNIRKNHCGIQNIHTLSSTYNYSHGNNLQPPKIMDTIFDSMLHDKDRYRPEQQIQMAQDIWLTGLDKPLWAKTLQCKLTKTSDLLLGLNKDPKDDAKECLDSLIEAWSKCVLYNDYVRKQKLYDAYCHCYNTLSKYKLSGTNTTITQYMETLSETNFNIKPCWKVLPYIFDFMAEGDAILQHIKTVIIPILCLITGKEKYDVFFGCYNDYPTFKQMIEQQFNKPLCQNNSQNNQLPDTNNQNNNINNINNNTNIINNNNIIINDNIKPTNINSYAQPQGLSTEENNQNTNNISGYAPPQGSSTGENNQYKWICIPKCCTNLCAKIFPNNTQSKVNS